MNDELGAEAPLSTPPEGSQPSIDGISIESVLGDVPLDLTVELGRVKMPMSRIIERLGPGSVVPLTKLTGDLLDVRVNDRLVAKAEAVAIGDRYGIRIVSVSSNADLGGAS